MRLSCAAAWLGGSDLAEAQITNATLPQAHQWRPLTALKAPWEHRRVPSNPSSSSSDSVSQSWPPRSEIASSLSCYPGRVPEHGSLGETRRQSVLSGGPLDDDISSGSDRGLVRDDANRPPPDQILLNPPGGQLPFDTTTLGDRAEEIGWPLVRNPSYDLPEF